MRILGIESSCDDTSVALVEAKGNGYEILAEKTASQIEVHKKYGGVVPEVAGRQHAENILPVVEAVMEGFEKPDVIAVTSGPGLITGLLVGVEVAKTLSYLWDVPIVGVNHIEGHIYSTQLGRDEDLKFPTLVLIASGGHTELVLMKDHGEYESVGKTRDDAVGECFDKVGKLLGFVYPGGPQVSKMAEAGDAKAIAFPRPMLKDGFDMSFSGLKTSVLYWVRDNKPMSSKLIAKLLGRKTVADVCASFEQAIVDVLVTKTVLAVNEYSAKTVLFGGGVSANRKIRESLKEALPDVELHLPEPGYSMDNAAMIAVAGYRHAVDGAFTAWDDLRADPNWKL